MPPLFKFAKNTFMTAYPIKIKRNIIKIGLSTADIPPNTPDTAASCQVPASFSEESIRCAASPNVSPEPLRPRVRLACSDTHRRYSSTGTVENKLAAKKPFNAFTPVSRMLPLPF